MKKSLFVVGILVLVFILNFVSSVTYPSPSISDTSQNTDSVSQKNPSCSDYNIPDGESLCIEQTCPGADQNKCYCSMLCGYTAIEAGNIQSNLQSKIGSSVGTTSSVSGEAKSLARGSDSLYVLDDFALRQELDNPLDFKKKEDCNKSNGCYFEGDCFLTEDIINSNYCFKGEFIPQKSWGNLCEQDFECLEGFCFEGKCYRGGKDNYLKNKNKELEKRLENLENTINQKDNTTKTNSITGAVIDNSVGKQSWIVRIWRKFFG